MEITELFEKILSEGDDRVELSSIEDTAQFAALVSFVKDMGRYALETKQLSAASAIHTFLLDVEAASADFAAREALAAEMAEAFTTEIAEEPVEVAEAFEVEAEPEPAVEVLAAETAVEVEEAVVEEETLAVEEIVAEEPEVLSAVEEGSVEGQVNMEEFNNETPSQESSADGDLSHFNFVWKADVQDQTAGRPVETLRDLAQALVARHITTTTRGVAGIRQELPVATIDYSASMDMTAAANGVALAEQFNAIRNSAVNDKGRALVASGGLCVAPERFYDFCKMNVPEDLVQDFLPAMNVVRGGITFYASPDIRDAFSGGLSIEETPVAEAVSKTYTIANDEAGDAKTCVTFPCPTEVSCEIEAQYLCLQFGNIQSRAYPEWVEHWISLAMDVHAHYVSAKLMAQIESLVDDVTIANDLATYAGGLGATATIFSTIDLAVADYRHDMRTGRSLTFEAIIPSWGFDMIRADLSKSGRLDGVTDAQIRQWFAIRGVTVRQVTDWYAVDADVTGAAINGANSSGVYTSATSAAARSGGASLATGGATSWSSEFPIIFFPRGTFVKLDMGTLDLGIVRDSVLNATNDYQLFIETFESVCKPGCGDARRYNIPSIVSGAFADNKVFA